MKIATVLAVLAWLALNSSVVAGGSAPPGFVPYHLNGPKSQPVTADGITTFHITPKDCDRSVTYNDNENDCINAQTHGQIQWKNNAKLGESVEYAFDLWTDPGLAYAGKFRTGLEALPYMPGGWDTDLRAASWEGPFRKDFVYILKVDATLGYTFLGKQCAPPSSFGQWVHFSMKIHWANDDQGWIQVTCDDRIVYLAEGVSTTRQTECYLQNECLPGTVRDPKTINFLLGPVIMGDGSKWRETGGKRVFVPLQKDGINMKARNIVVRRGVDLYGPNETALVKQLQQALDALGCPVGPATGVVNAETRSQTVLCRDFPDAEKPPALTVATLATFVQLYTRPDASGSPPGTAVQPAPYVIHVAGRADDPPPPGDDTVYPFNALIEQPNGDMVPINFILIGPFDHAGGNFYSLEVLIDHDVGKAAAALQKCSSNRLEEHGEDGTRLVLRFGSPWNNKFGVDDLACDLNALPGDLRYKTAFVVDHFAELASTLVKDGSVPREITNPDVQTFIQKVAAGDIVVGRGD